MADMREHQCRTGGVCLGDRRRVVLQPLVGTLFERQHLTCRNRQQANRHPGAGFIDVDLVVQIQAIGQRHLIQQQILGGEIAFLRQRVERRIVTVHILVQALENIGHGIDVGHFGLLPQPLGEGLDITQKRRIADAALPRAVQ